MKKFFARFSRWLLLHGPIAAILLTAIPLRAFRLTEPSGGLIGDEVYYVQDARVIVGLPIMFHHLPGTAASGLDPNAEHPPLAKLIMALFIRVFGERDFIWRVPSIILGTFGIWLLYRIVMALGGTRRQAIFAAFVFAFENLTFVHGRIAMLEIYMSTFVLLGTLLYLRSYYEYAGLAFGVATLCKINGVLGLVAVIFYEIVRSFRGSWRPSWKGIRPCVLTGFFCIAFFLAGLGALDSYWTEFRNPVTHVVSMINYARSLTRLGPPQGAESTPLQWWLNSGVINYFVVTTNANGQSYTPILFRGAMNEYFIFAAPLALAYAARRAWAGTSRMAAFAIGSLVANFGPVFFAWALAHRMSYIYYMVPSIPAIVCAITLLFSRTSRGLRWCFAAAMVYAFAFSFPFHYF
jgi:dolichyl-phosphate-mannose-protein mannosyltransferase